jgi:hypothetical protein
MAPIISTISRDKPSAGRIDDEQLGLQAEDGQHLFDQAVIERDVICIFEVGGKILNRIWRCFHGGDLGGGAGKKGREQADAAVGVNDHLLPSRAARRRTVSMSSSAAAGLG